MPPFFRRGRLTWAAFALAVLCGACGDASEPNPIGSDSVASQPAPETAFLDAWRSAAPTDSDPTPTAEELLARFGAAERFAADFSAPTQDGASGRWSFLGTRGQPRLAKDALRIRSTADARAVWEVSIDAETTTHLALRFARIPSKRSGARLLRVYWQPEGTSDFVPDLAHSATLAYADAEGREALIPVGRQPSWRGGIRALAFEFRTEETVALESVRGVDLAPAMRSWLTSEEGRRPRQAAVEIQRLRVRALAAPSGTRLHQRLQVEPQTSFHARFALHPSSAFLPGSRTRFSIHATADGTTSELARYETPSPDYPRLAGWHRAEVDLSAYAGKEIDLELRTEAVDEPGTAASDSTTGLALWGDPRLGSSGAPTSPAANAPREVPPNLLLISIDTLRADHLDAYGYGLPTAPGIAQLAREGLRFARCTANAPSTLPSHGSLFTGIPSHANRIYGYGGHRLAAARETLAETLRTAGFATAAFAGGGYFDPYYGLDQGFDTYSYAKTGNQALDYSDLEFNVGRALDWLRANADRRFFLFLHTYEVHGPFQPREDYVELFVPEGVRPPRETSDLSTNARALPLSGPDFPGWRQFVDAPEEPEAFHPDAMARVRASYDSEIRRTDVDIARVLATLEELGLAEDTLVVLTSDHGESFLEHGRTGHGHLYEHNLRVPLLMRMPGRITPGSVFEDRVQLADVAPTCLELLGLANATPPGAAAAPSPALHWGTSLVEHFESPSEPNLHRAIVSYANDSGLSYLTPGETKLIVNLQANHPQAGRWEYYDLEADPGELADASEALSDVERAALSARVRATLTEIPGVHVLLHAEEPIVFDTRLTLEGSHSPLERQLHAFPLSNEWLDLSPDGSVGFTSSALEDLWLHLHAGDGRLVLRGTLRDPRGDASLSAALEWTVPLAALNDGPRSLEVRGTDGRLVASLVALCVAIEGGDSDAGDASLSAETLQQLQDLGYL